ncbi:GNAT family N-acetyltransferase [Actinoplanes sp. NPDC051859]|uniref:GNAT family N-acetyltransferase n=1 Tax=Actinoplanes sp. NPDC051859 TaxID=3363909 RepID=UPI0037BD2054
MSAEPSARWLSADELESWLPVGGLLLRLPAALDAQMQRDSGLSHFEYLVLANLSEAPDRTRRMSALAALANGSLSRLSHVVKRLEGKGWVARTACPRDGRYTNAALTEAGWEKVRHSAPGHVEAVRDLVLDALTEAELAQLGGIARRVLTRLEAAEPNQVAGRRRASLPAMPQLITPTVHLHAQWLAARDEWGRGVHQDGSGLRADDEVDTAAGFAAFVAKLRRESDPAVPPVAGWVHCSYWWIAEGDQLLGAVSLRHELNDILLDAGGHIGYGIRPSARRRGLASWALNAVLPYAGKLGLDRVLLTCEVTNEASRRVIERRGGVLEDVRDTPLGRVRRYWITLDPAERTVTE